MKRSWRMRLGAVVLGCVFAAAAVSADSDSPAQGGADSQSQGGANGPGDVAAGRRMFYTCMGCHGIEGYSNIYPTFHVPKLGGQHAAYIVSALKEYRSGKRKHAAMHAQASSLSDQQIKNIAAFLSQQKPE